MIRPPERKPSARKGDDFDFQLHEFDSAFRFVKLYITMSLSEVEWVKGYLVVLSGLPREARLFSGGTV